MTELSTNPAIAIGLKLIADRRDIGDDLSLASNCGSFAPPLPKQQKCFDEHTGDPKSRGHIPHCAYFVVSEYACAAILFPDDPARSQMITGTMLDDPVLARPTEATLRVCQNVMRRPIAAVVHDLANKMQHVLTRNCRDRSVPPPRKIPPHVAREFVGAAQSPTMAVFEEEFAHRAKVCLVRDARSAGSAPVSNADLILSASILASFTDIAG